MIRSFLFVPADSERKLFKATESQADAIIVDLEDAVAAKMRPAARQQASAFIAENDNAWVRINPIDTKDAIADLEAVVAAQPAGIVLPKPRSAADVSVLADRLNALENSHQLTSGRIQILPLCTERPEALFSLHGYIGISNRLFGLSWGGEDLAAALGASANRDDKGNWLSTYELARSLCLVAASAASVAAIDTVFTDFKNSDGLKRYAQNARRDGFSGMLAIHPQQIEIINAAFEPSPDELAQAERIVALFADNPNAGALSLDGKMVDWPHLAQARKILATKKS